MNLQMIGTGFVAIVGWVVAFTDKYKEDISAIVKKVEADSKDGWSVEEKLALAQNLFEDKVYPKMPVYIKIFGKKLVTKWAMKIIERICKKAKLLK